MLKNPFKKLEKKLHSEVNLEYTVKTGFILIDSEESSVYNLPHVLKKSLKTMNIHEKKETGHLDALQAALNDLCSHKSQNDLRCIICKDGTVIQLKNFDFMDSSLIQLSVHFPSDPKHHENRLMDHLSKHPFGKRNPDHLHKRLQILNSCQIAYYFALMKVENMEAGGPLKDEQVYTLALSRIQSRMSSADLAVHLGNGEFALILAAQGRDQSLADIENRLQEIMNFHQTAAKVGYKTGIIHSASLPVSGRLFDAFRQKAQIEMENSECQRAFC